MALHRRSPRALSHALAPLRLQMAPQTLMAEVVAAWPEAAGELIARFTTPASERAGTLTVHCETAAWTQELNLMSLDVIAKLNPHLTRGQITALHCVSRPAR